MILTHLVQFGFIKGASAVAVVVPPDDTGGTPLGGAAVGGPGFGADPFRLKDAAKRKLDVEVVVALMVIND